MTSSPVPQPERPPAPMKPPSRRAVAIAVVGGLVVVGALLALLWSLVDDGSPQAPAQLELVRIALTILLGTGGVFGLYLAWRRQRSVEIGLQQKERDQVDVARAYELQRQSLETTRLHQERVAVANERDAEARRITDLYIKAVEQLGSDKAPVRLGGLYALERLAQDHADQRPTIVNVLCAYLRMPYEPSSDLPEEPTADQVDEHLERAQEREVRLAAQRILAAHMRWRTSEGTPGETFWNGISLDLTGATLVDLDLSGCAVDATFHSATFSGDTNFRGTTFVTLADFGDATFSGHAIFVGATFRKSAMFWLADFEDTVDFSRTKFLEDADFYLTTFAGAAFDRGQPTTPYTDFSDARFERGVPTEVAVFVSAESEEGAPDSEGDPFQTG